MEIVKNMVESHPTFKKQKSDEVENCISACFECASACTICADACLSKEDSDLTDCIKNNLMCADICTTTARMLSFQNTTNGALTLLLKACQRMCEVTAAECREHSETMKHCKICADTCQDCIDACESLQSA